MYFTQLFRTHTIGTHVFYMGPYRVCAKCCVKYMGPYRSCAKSCAKYMGPYHTHDRDPCKIHGSLSCVCEKVA